MQSCESFRRLHFLSTILFYLALTVIHPLSMYNIPRYTILSCANPISISVFTSLFSVRFDKYAHNPEDASTELKIVIMI